MARQSGSTTSEQTCSPSVARACVNCQKRKSRCLRGDGRNGPCSYCARTGKTCSFEAPPDRTPLTRKELDAAEDQCKKLRVLLRSLNPDVDIESALKGLQGRTTRTDTRLRHQNHSDSEKDPVDEQSSSCSYEWHEQAPHLESCSQASDGMAMIATNESGYLGMLATSLAIATGGSRPRAFTLLD